MCTPNPLNIPLKDGKGNHKGGTFLHGFYLFISGSDFHERGLLYSESTYTNTSCGTSVTSDFSDDSFFDIDEDFDLFNENVSGSVDELAMYYLNWD